MAFHGVINTTHCVATNVDAYNLVGIYTTADVDNGTLVSVGAINKDATNQIDGYEFTVALPAENAVGLCVVDSPAIGTGVDNLYDDPRYFVNKAGEPLQLRKLVAGVDYIEVDAKCFAADTLPDITTNAYASVNTSGKLVAAASAPASGTYFTVAGKHSFDIGGVIIPTVVMLCARN